MTDEELDIKTILVGMSGAGKTNIINAMINHPFDDNKISTSTSSFVDKYVDVGKHKCHVEIWDTAGQEQYKSLTKIFINDSKIVIFVYDITNEISFSEVDYWVKVVKEMLGEEPVYGLFANKKDLYMYEKVDEETGRNKAEEIGAIFKLTSAKTEWNGINDGLKELLTEYCRRNISNNSRVEPRGMTLDSIDLSRNRDKDKSKCCK